MMREFWAWLSTQPQGAASFLGTVTGSFLGLVALLAGALFNAHLSRRRDDRLRRIEARAVAASLTTELRQFEDILLRNADGLAQANSAFLVPDIGQMIRMLPELASKLVLLEPVAIRKVLTAYSMVEQYGQRLMLMGGVPHDQQGGNDKRLIALPMKLGVPASELNQNVGKVFHEAIVALRS